MPLDIQERYEELRLDNPSATAPAIASVLREEFKGRNPPDPRTIRNWLREDGQVVAQANLWTLGSFDVFRTRVILGALGELASEGTPESQPWWLRDGLPEDEAWWIGQLRGASPAMPVAVVQLLARLYWMRTAAGQDSRDLDAFVALEPWLDGAERYIGMASRSGGKGVPTILLNLVSRKWKLTRGDGGDPFESVSPGHLKAFGEEIRNQDEDARIYAERGLEGVREARPGRRHNYTGGDPK